MCMARQHDAYASAHLGSPKVCTVCILHAESCLLHSERDPASEAGIRADHAMGVRWLACHNLSCDTSEIANLAARSHTRIVIMQADS